MEQRFTRSEIEHYFTDKERTARENGETPFGDGGVRNRLINILMHEQKYPEDYTRPDFKRLHNVGYQALHYLDTLGVKFLDDEPYVMKEAPEAKKARLQLDSNLRVKAMEYAIYMVKHSIENYESVTETADMIYKWLVGGEEE